VTALHEALFPLALAALVTACNSPNDSGLFSLVPGGGGSGAAGTSGSGTDAGGGVSGIGGTGSLEGTGGSLGLAGASPGGASGTEPPDAGQLDADAGLADAGDAAPEAGPPPCVPSQEVCDGRDNACQGVADPPGTCATQCEGFVVGGRSYMFCNDAVVMDEARGRCQLEGLRLVWLETPEESAALVARVAALSVAPPGNAELLTLIGASDAAEEGEWRWVGTPAIADGPQFWQGGPEDDDGQATAGAYAAWSDGEPNDGGNEDCAVISVRGGNNREAERWDDRSCADDSFPFLCEVP
jgi:hypothetical protein